MTIENLLSRLEKVKKTGAGRWMASCPNHKDRSPSLQITEKDDGILLIKCFAQCPTPDVLAKVGLTFEDLYPERLPDHRYPPQRRPFNAHDVLAALTYEMSVAKIITAKIARGEGTPVDRQRLNQCSKRIAQAEDMANG